MMEAVVVIAAALTVMVLLEAGYRIALCLACWAPSLLLGLFLGWLAHRHGVKTLEAIALAALTIVIAKRVLLQNFLSDQRH